MTLNPLESKETTTNKYYGPNNPSGGIFMSQDMPHEARDVLDVHVGGTEPLGEHGDHHQ
jgi:hypothetical protein